MSTKYNGINRHRHYVKLRKNEIIHSCFTMINGQHCSNLDGLIAKTCPVVPAYIGKWGQNRPKVVVLRSKTHISWKHPLNIFQIMDWKENLHLNVVKHRWRSNEDKLLAWTARTRPIKGPSFNCKFLVKMLFTDEKGGQEPFNYGIFGQDFGPGNVC